MASLLLFFYRVSANGDRLRVIEILIKYNVLTALPNYPLTVACP